MTGRLVVAAHGTRYAPGNAVARSLAAGAAAVLGRPVQASYVELSDPLLGDVLAESDEAATVLPLLLSTGYHVRHDLPATAARAPGRVRLLTPLGPDPGLTAAQVARLAEVGAVPGDPVVMVAAGSRDPASLRDLARARALLAHAWDGPVRLATVTGVGGRPADVVRPGDAVSPYLLAPGFFADRARREAQAAGARLVADVLGPHPELVRLVATRLAVASRFRERAGLRRVVGAAAGDPAAAR